VPSQRSESVAHAELHLIGGADVAPVVFLGRRLEGEDALRPVRARECPGCLPDMGQQRDRPAAVGRKRLLPPVRVQQVEEIEDIELRGDVSTSGESFVSGHAILVAALATVIWPYLPARWRPVLWVLVALVMIGRVYVGAHNPLDVVCGAALGVAIGLAVNLLLGAPDGHRHRAATAAEVSRPVS